MPPTPKSPRALIVVDILAGAFRDVAERSIDHMAG